MNMRRWTRDARLSLARLPALGMSRVPDAPSQPVRDLWPGDPARGARLMKGEFNAVGMVRPLAPGNWAQGGEGGAPEALRAALFGFGWLRDLRALGTDGARLRARALVGDWLSRAPADPLARLPDVTGARLGAWLGHYDFFAASADDGFRQRLMARMLADARMLAAMVPAPVHDVRALTALKGLIAAGIAMPENTGFLSRAMRYLTPELGRQVLPDGCHVARSPAAQLAALRELAEIRSLLQAGQIGAPLALSACLDRMAPVLRAMRHGDGGLALFNGAQEGIATQIDLVLSQAGRGRSVASEMGDGGYQRITAGRTVLIADSGLPAPAGLDRDAHAGTLAFELSVGRERLIVNCGAAASAAWRDALRATAAHSTLVVEDRNSAELKPDGFGRRPRKVTADRKESGHAHWLDLSHDGYAASFAVLHHRRLYVSENGEDIRGEDAIEGVQGAAPPRSFTLRFHLHPGVRPQLDEDDPGSVILALQGGSAWRLRVDGGALGVEESIYCGGERPVPSQQVVVSVMLPPVPAERDEAASMGPAPDAEREAVAQAADGTTPEKPADEKPAAPQTIRWALARLPA